MTQLLVAVVDDEAPIRRALARLLRCSGYRVSELGSGAELLEALDQMRPDCLVLDVHMPNLGGLDVLLELNKSHRTLPSILITGSEDQQVLRACAESGVPCLCKPFTQQELIESLHSVLGANSGDGVPQAAGP